jgi:hypothetical protein
MSQRNPSAAPLFAFPSNDIPCFYLAVALLATGLAGSQGSFAPLLFPEHRGKEKPLRLHVVSVFLF